jgi:Domain of unknown function (DUF4158)/Tn3 transposase DDE domain
MPRRELLSSAQREAFLAFPSEEAELLRHYTFSTHDFAVIRRCRGLNLVVAAIVLWNTVYLERAIKALRGHHRRVHGNFVGELPEARCDPQAAGHHDSHFGGHPAGKPDVH